MTDDIDITALLAEARSSHRKGKLCWAIEFRAETTPTGRAFLDAVEADPKKFVPGRVSEILLRKFNFNIGRCGVDNHMRGECTCPKRSPKIQP